MNAVAVYLKLKLKEQFMGFVKFPPEIMPLCLLNWNVGNHNHF